MAYGFNLVAPIVNESVALSKLGCTPAFPRAWNSLSMLDFCFVMRGVSAAIILVVLSSVLVVRVCLFVVITETSRLRFLNYIDS